MTDTIQTSATYKKLRFTMIKLFEGTDKVPYMDNKSPNPQVTIGIGFNIEGNSTLRTKVYEALGLTNSPADQVWKAALDSIITDSRYLANDKVNIKDDLDAKMAERNGTTTTFSLTDDQIESIFNVAILDFETILDTWLGGVVIKEEGQRAALVSLAWNAFIHDPVNKTDAQGHPFISIGAPKLNQALKNGNRAEAWYEMRYLGTPPGRHYTEAQVFGLYENPASVSDAEAKKVVDMFIAHKDAIAATNYEVKSTFDIANAYLATNNLNIKSSITNQYTADTLGQILKPVAKYIYTRFTPADIQTLFPAADLNIDGDVVLGYETSSALSGGVKSIQPLYVFDYNKNPDGKTSLPKGVTGINDFLMGLDGKSYIMQGLYGNDVIIGADKDDTIYGGFATAKANSGNDILMGASGDDKIYGQDNYDFLYGGVGIDHLYGGTEADHLYGGDGADFLNGGDEILDASGAADGYDILEGGAGNDTYIFNGNFGRDMIKDSDGVGSLIINGAALPALTQITKDGIIYRDEANTYQAVKIIEGTKTSLIISSVANPANSITLKDWADVNNLGITLSPAADPVVNAAGNAPMTGNVSDNVLTMENFWDGLPEGPVRTTYTHLTASGGDGQDFLLGTLTGSDKLEGGIGNDIISSGVTVTAGTGIVRDEMDIYYATDGNLMGADTINGNEGEDYIVTTGTQSIAYAGADNDILNAGAALYIGVNGARFDTAPGVYINLSRDQVWADFKTHIKPKVYNVTETDGSTSKLLSEVDPANNATNWQRFTSQVAGVSYWYLQRPVTPGSHMVTIEISYAATGPEMIETDNGRWGFNSQNDLSVSFISLPESYFLAPEVIDTLANTKGATFFGEAGDDQLFGSAKSDYLSGGADKDEIFGHRGNDIIDGGTENDMLRGGAGDDTLIGGAGTDYLYGDGENLTDTGLSDNDVLYGGDDIDYLFGDYGKDYLDGGTGADSLDGGEGDDYLYGGDDNEMDSLFGGAGTGNDIIVLGKSDTAVRSAGKDIYIWDTHQVTTTPTAPSVTANANAASSGTSLADNVLLNTATQLADAAFIVGDAGDSTLALIGASNIAELAFSLAGNNILINTGEGQQIVIQDGVTSAPMQIISGTSVAQVASSNIEFTPITDNTFLNGSDQLAQTQINTAGLLLSNLQTVVTATAATANNFLAGGLVNDTLTANSGGTKFIGGRGDDTLKGDIGNDTYLIRSGDGNDIITEKGGVNTIKLDAGITAAQTTTPLRVSHSGADLVIHISAEQSVTVKNMFDANTGALINANAIQNLQFFDNTNLDLTALKQRMLTSTNGDDVIGGFETVDTLNGGKGSDQLSGGAGDDVYQFALGDGNDIIVDTAGNDRIELTGGILQNQVKAYRDGYNNLVLQLNDGGKITIANALDSNGNFSGNAIETIQFSDNSTWNAARIQQETLNFAGNSFNGTSGSNALTGSTGKDIIIGGQGNDTLRGDAGDDTYRYALGDGDDVITDISGVDRIEFLPGIFAAQTIARSNGSDLVLSLNDGATVTVKDMFVNKSQIPIDPVVTSVINNLQNNWMSQAESIIENNFGLVGSGDITLRFQHGVAGAEAAHVDITTPVGANAASKLELIIDLDDFSASPNGSGPIYYDRIIAHEMVHAVMARNMNMQMLPGWFTEGAAELIQGADERVKSDMAIIGNQTNFNLLFKTTVGSPSSSAGYSVSYIAVKLLDSEIKANGGTGIKDLFAELKTGKTLDQSLAALSTSLGGMSGLWTNLSSFETHFQTAGFASMNALLNLNNADTGSIAGSDYGNTALDPYAVIANTTTGLSQHFNLIVPQEYQNTVGVVNEIETITFADGSSWDAAQIVQEIQKNIGLTINGTDADDVLSGSALDDTFMGGKGDDYLVDAAGNDTYVFNRGDGTDAIDDYAGTDTIKLGAGISENNLTLKRSVNDLVLTLDTGESVIVLRMFYSSSVIEKIEFANGTQWDLERIKREVLKGTENNDVIYGYETDDLIIGGIGNDSLYGQAGNDTYEFNVGDGQDTIYDWAGTDTLKLGAGILESNVTLARNEGDLLVILDTGEQITINSVFVTTGEVGAGAIETIQFANGSVWDMARIKQETFKSTAGADFIYGFETDDVINGGLGDDNLFGAGGNDTYEFNLGDGVDFILDAAGTDTIKFGAGILENNVHLKRMGTNVIVSLTTGEQITINNMFFYDSVLSENAMEIIQFANGTVWNQTRILQELLKGTPNDDVIYGGTGNDVIAGGAGSDQLFGGAGNDTYEFNLGDGVDTVVDSAGTDTIKLGAGISESNVILRRNNSDLLLTLNTGEKITAVNMFNGMTGAITANAIEVIQFANGTVWNAARIKQEALKGTAGSDIIYGFETNDVLAGGAGSDQLFGGAGNDTYEFNLGDGMDVIGESAGIDVLKLGAGIEENNVSLRRYNTNLVLTLTTGESFVVAGMFDLSSGAVIPANTLESIQFASGNVWDLARIQAEIIKPLIINGTGGNDILTGDVGDDTYNGGGGFDYLGESWGGGNDTYTFKRGDGINIIQDGVGSNTLSFAAGINPGDVMVYRSEADMYFLLNNGEMIETLDSSGQMSRVTFANGDVWNAQMIEQKIAETAAKPNTLIGRFSWDTLAVGAGTGNYYINGLGGKNNLFGGAGNDTLVAGSGIEDRFGNPVINDMNGGAGNDTYLIGEAPSRNYIKQFRGDNDRVLFSEGINPADVTVRIVHPDNFNYIDNGVLWVYSNPRVSDWQLLLTIGDQAHPTTVAIDSLFNSSTNQESGATIKNPEIVTGTVEFMNGTVWTINDLIGRALLGSASADTINGTGNSDSIQGGNGNDSIFGYSGSDTLSGGLGNDILSGGDDDDTYQYSLGDGSDTINETIGNDRLEFGSGIVPSNLTFKRNYDSLLVSINGSSDVITLTDWFNTHTVETFAFTNGTNLKPTDIINALTSTIAKPVATIDNTGIITGTAIPNSLVYIDYLADDLSYVIHANSVQADAVTGAFSFTLHASLMDGRDIYVSTQDVTGLGNVSAATLISTSGLTPPDVTAPDQPTATFDITGKIVTGIAEAGSSVVVKNASLVEIGNAVANATTGAYSITLATALINKEIVNVTAKDAAGNISVAKSIAAPDLTAPTQPTAAIDTTGKIITGVAEINSTVIVKNAASVQIGTATANATTGAYTVTLATALINNEIINVTAKDAAGNISVVKTITAPDKTAPSLPTAAFDTTGKIISGIAEINSTVIVKNAAATQIGTATANATTGAYSITLATALINTEIVNVTAKDAAGNISVAKSIAAPDLTAPTQPTAAIDTTGKIITGVAEINSTVIVKNATATQIGTATANATTGAYTVTLATALINNEIINVTAKDAAGNTSVVKTITAPDKTAPSLPTAAFDTTGKIISGVAEINSTVIVKNAAATQIGIATANATTGAYAVTLATALINKEVVSVTAKDAAGNISAVASATAPLIDVTPPAQPTAAFDATGKIITGVAEINSTVIVKNAASVQIGTATANATTGAYTVTLATALINKDLVSVTAKDAAGNVSTVRTIIAPDLTAPSQPTAAFDTTGKIITGVAEAGSTVVVKNTANTQLGTVVANATTGAYSITLATALLNNQLVNITAKDVAGNISVVKSINAPDKTAPSVPTAAFDTTGKIITGVAEINSTVIVKNAASVQIGTATANATTGAYTVTLTTALINKDVVSVTAKDAAGNISTAKSITAPDLTAPSQPTAAFATTGKTITGVAEKSSIIIVKNAANTQLGTATANATTGAYTITLTTALLNNEVVNVTAKDAAGNISVAKTINAPDKTAPAKPTAAFDTTGKIISGIAEAGSTVVVKKSTTQIGTVVANATTGAYSITLATALVNKEVVSVTAKDVAGNTSAATSVTAPLVTVALSATKTVKMSAPDSITAQADALIQAMAAFAPPTAAQTKNMIGYYDTTHPMLVSHG